MVTNSESQMIEDIASGKIKLHEADRLAGENKAAELRKKALEKKLKISLMGVAQTSMKPENCRPNIENMIGAVQIPLGIAGPVMIEGEAAKGSYYLPLATTEGALVASVSRGCSAINKSGGAVSVILKNEQSRSILFKAASVAAAKKFSDWAEQNFPALKKAGEEGERFLEIKKIERYITGLNIWLRIKAYTNDAMGMNMVTMAGKRIADYISNNYEGIGFVSESGNMCVDKKPSAMGLINTRGKKVIASCDLKEEVIHDVLKTTPDRLVEMNYRKNLLGSASSGSLGFNAHFANIIAAMFIATGQDAAHVADGSMGITTVEKNSKGVNFSVTIPSLHVGTIGGGTGLPTQKESLSIMGVDGAGNPPGSNSKKLAEIVSVAVLAGEISLLAALCTNDLSRAHMEHNR